MSLGIELQWTFPLAYMELISGDGRNYTDCDLTYLILLNLILQISNSLLILVMLSGHA
ncbi:MAG: hypothetical protein Ct9H90mP25_4290 [Gammaproteobacteria bacterium]|nr:MAG: hypothetical protein Ct9H90mP25_4290 [Gammaproteobacteria bacterium]